MGEKKKRKEIECFRFVTKTIAIILSLQKNEYSKRFPNIFGHIIASV